MPGGWANKMAVILQMFRAQEFTELKQALGRLSEHHSMQRPIQKVQKAYLKEGKAAYRKYLSQ